MKIRGSACKKGQVGRSVDDACLVLFCFYMELNGAVQCWFTLLGLMSVPIAGFAQAVLHMPSRLMSWAGGRWLSKKAGQNRQVK